MRTLNKHFGHFLVKYLIVLGTLTLLGTLVPSNSVKADYVDNNLISDAVFRDYLPSDLNTIAKIQAFLSSKGGYIAGYSSYSDRDATNVSAAQIIYEAAQDFGINPKVILATMQKEESLVTDPSPSSSQVNYAMGYGCFDATGCSGNYGFYNQVNNATWQLRMNFERVSGNNSWGNTEIKTYGYACNGATRYYNMALRTGNNVTFYDDSGLGYKTLTIANAATASLYCYTPHVYPGSANQYYSGSYNFVSAFERWFGSTYGAVQLVSPLRMVSSVNEGLFTTKKINFSFDIKNTMSSTANIGNMMIAVRDSKGNNFDFGVVPVQLAPGELYTYSVSQSFDVEEVYSFSISNYQAPTGWSDDIPSSSSPGIVRQITTQIQAIPTITQTPGPEDELRYGKLSNCVFSVKNNSSTTLNLGNLGMAIRGPQGQNLDLPGVNLPSLSPGSVYTYTKPFTPLSMGRYSFSIAFTLDGGASWSEPDFFGVPSGMYLNSTVDTKPSPSVTSGLTVNPAQPKVGEKTTITYTVTNFGGVTIDAGKLGIALRSPDGLNMDPRWDIALLQPGSSFNYSVDIYPNKAGRWFIAVGGFRGNDWNLSWLANDSNTNMSAIFSVEDNPTITQGISVSPSQPRVGQNVTVSYAITNAGDLGFPIELTGLAIRDSKGINLDSGWVSPLVGSRSSYNYSKIVKFSNSGLANIVIGGKKNGSWSSDVLIPSGSGDVVRSLQLNVLSSPTITKGISVEGGQNVGSHLVNFTVKNYGDDTISLGKMGVAIRDPFGKNYDALWEDFVINSSSERVYSVSVLFDKPGVWKLQIGNYNGQWNSNNPVSESDQIVRQMSLDIK